MQNIVILVGNIGQTPEVRSTEAAPRSPTSASLPLPSPLPGLATVRHQARQAFCLFSFGCSDLWQKDQDHPGGNRTERGNGAENLAFSAVVRRESKDSSHPCKRACLQFVCFGPRTGCLSKAPGLQRVDLYQWKRPAQSSFQCPVIGPRRLLLTLPMALFPATSSMPDSRLVSCRNVPRLRLPADGRQGRISKRRSLRCSQSSSPCPMLVMGDANTRIRPGPRRRRRLTRRGNGPEDHERGGPAVAAASNKWRGWLRLLIAQKPPFP